MKKLLLAAVLSIPVAAHAGDYKESGADAVGYGVAPCGKVAASAPSIQSQFFNWAQGFMTGANAVNEVAHKPSRNLTAQWMHNQILWLKLYCQRHPAQTYSIAVSHLYVSLPFNGGTAVSDSPPTEEQPMPGAPPSAPHEQAE